MTITLTPEIEKALDETARQRGTTREQVALETLQAGLVPSSANGSHDTAERERKDRVRAAKGSLAHLGLSTFMHDKEEEKAREERRWHKTPEGEV